jgi:hypothetical protein
MLPFTLFDTDYITLVSSQVLLEFRTGKEIAAWKIHNQKVLPKQEGGSASAVSHDGMTVAIGGGGALNVYRVSP